MLNYPSINVGSTPTRGSREAIVAEAQNYPAEYQYVPATPSGFSFGRGPVDPGSNTADCTFTIDDQATAESVRFERSETVLGNTEWFAVGVVTSPGAHNYNLPASSESVRAVNVNINGETPSNPLPFN